MIGFIIVLAIVGALAAGISAGLAVWARGLQRRTRVVLAALLSSGLPLSLALRAAVAAHAGAAAFVSIVCLILLLAGAVGWPVALAMTRNERPVPPLDQTFD